MNFEQKRNIGFLYVIEKIIPKSGFGKKMLKKIIPFIKKNELLEELTNLMVFIEALRKESTIFNALNSILSHVKDIDGTFSRIGSDLTQTELFEIKNFCNCSNQIFNELYNLDLNLTNLPFFNLSEPFRILNKTNSDGFIISDEYSKNLASIRQEKKIITKEMISQTGENYHLLKEKHLALSAKEQEEEFFICRKLSEELLTFKEQMQTCAISIAKIDLLIQKAFLCVFEDCILPIISETSFEIINATNPSVADNLRKNNQTFTPITLSVKGATVITGANMGGKTVALKTIALNTYLALCGMPVFAEKFILPFLSFVEIVSEDLQSSERGLSSFGGEVIKINQLYQQAKRSTGLLLIDEFAGGTNAQEGAKIFSALLRALKQTPSFSILTTHFDDVCDHANLRYQIIGLSEKSKEILRNTLNVNQDNISQHMNYGLIPMDNHSEIPKNAIDVCILLGLNEEIISLIEK